MTPAFGAEPAFPSVRYISTNGIRMAAYEAGTGPAVVLLHGFPELAYSWRHQIPALAAAGFRVIAPDMRGYGLTDRPPAVEDYDMAHLTSDLVGLLDALGIQKAAFVGHDWGGIVAWQMPLFHKDRVEGVIGVNTPFVPHEMLWLHPVHTKKLRPDFVLNLDADPIEQMRQVYSPDMYVLMMLEGDRVDRLLVKDVSRVFRATMRKGVITQAEYQNLPPEAHNLNFLNQFAQPEPERLPGEAIITPTELSFYVENFERTGFTPGINYYRNLSRNWKAGLGVGQAIRVPALMIGAEDDVVLPPSMMEGMDTYVPDLEKHVIANCGHWTTQEKPEELNRLLIDWLTRRVLPADATRKG
ncbi:MAG: alpha/beta hydrolase [Mesorhizobium sp.]|uniref:alpha/beta fold hydrolase n=1 Tax=Mesorhizobium sp. TaxID=1871066 RepID=UPI001217EE7C|nr:alpha/beta hydrolase [Mesorhizobium sp.]TIO78839.1 MAG: alpha/beta hydrolase [Mesorhizobium sp.]TIO88095.1 MAG: alpha/beta hydrolase [Mesorhizobium sp.]